MTPRTMTLQQLMAGLDILRLDGDANTPVHGIRYDSRQVETGDLFVALPGLKLDGHRFVPEAAARGAAAAVVSQEVPRGFLKAVAQVAQPRTALALAAANFFGHPSLDLHLVGITGTNGKTTLTYLVEQLVLASGGTPGVIGTVNVRFSRQLWESAHTTPEASDLQSWLAQMREARVSHAVMEVSSHALDLERVRGAHFQVAVFTNLSRDHLDYHGDLDRYSAAKELLFSRELYESRAHDKVAVVNADDPRAAQMLRGWKGPVISFGLVKPAAVRPLGEVVEKLDGVSARLAYPGGELEVRSPLPGRHNLYNVMAAVAVGRALGFSPGVIARGIMACRTVPGRLERIDAGEGPAVFVDYAHTDQALVNVLGALRPLTNGRLIVVFGCGGDRDMGKRPMMGAAVARGSDLAVVTSDNPRTEDPTAIIEAIVPGLRGSGWSAVAAGELGGHSHGVFAVEADRRQAIGQAIRLARPQDVVLIAGKGHENYQIFGTTKQPFDDRQEARRILGLDGDQEAR